MLAWYKVSTEEMLAALAIIIIVVIVNYSYFIIIALNLVHKIQASQRGM